MLPVSKAIYSRRTSLALGSIRRCGLNCLKPHTTKTPPTDFDATKYRKWVNLSDKKHKTSSNISILSYNVLSQHYMWKPVFGYLNLDYLDWPGYRFPLINKSIKQFKCDIMCFQELELSVYDKFWSKYFPQAGYDSVYVRKPPPCYWGNLPIKCMDGIAIFVNSERFTILKQETVNYGKYISENPEKFEMTKDLKERVVLRNTVGVVVQLLDKITGERIYVTNTHLYWSPAFNDVKVIQTKILLTVVQDFIDKDDRLSPKIIMCGDFNSTPESDVCKLLGAGSVSPKNSVAFKDKDYGKKFNKEIDSPFKLSTAYNNLIKDHHLEFTSFTKSLTEILDHIWYSSGNFTVNRVLGEVDKEYCERDDVNGFPNNQFPSDHIPLVAEIGYK